jgi:hypothetical protein
VIEQAQVAFYCGAYHLWQIMISGNFSSDAQLQQITKEELQGFMETATREGRLQ